MEVIFTYIAIFINIMLIACGISVLIKRNLGITVLLSIILISIIEYTFGILNIMLIGKNVIFVLGIVSLLYMLIYFKKNKGLVEFAKKNMVEMIIFPILYILYIIIFQNQMVTSHNELTHWALLVKHMIYYDGFPINNTLTHIGYPPIVGVWEYWFSSFFNIFKDGYIYIANALLQSSLIIAIANTVKYKDNIQKLLSIIFWLIMYFIICYLVLNKLFVDATLAFLFVFAIGYIYKMKKLELVDFIIILTTAVFIELTKEIGIIFIIFILIYLLILQKGKEELKKVLIAIVSIILMVCLFKSSWVMFLKNNNLNQAWDTSGFNQQSISDFIVGEGEKYQYETINRFAEEVIQGGNLNLFGVQISLIAIILFSTIVIIAVYINKNKDASIKKILIIMVLFDFIFLISLLMMYLFSFTKLEAEILSGFLRYIQIIDLVNIGLMFVVIFNNYNVKKLFIIIAILFFVMANDRIYEEIIIYEICNKRTIQYREKYIGIEKYVHLFNEEDKIYLVTDYEPHDLKRDKREMDWLFIKYQIVPYYVAILDTEDGTLEKAEQKLQCGYTYVYFHECVDETISKYSKLLEDENVKIKKGMLFKIIYNNENKMKLQLVD